MLAEYNRALWQGNVYFLKVWKQNAVLEILQDIKFVALYKLNETQMLDLKNSVTDATL